MKILRDVKIKKEIPAGTQSAKRLNLIVDNICDEVRARLRSNRLVSDVKQEPMSRRTDVKQEPMTRNRLVSDVKQEPTNNKTKAVTVKIESSKT